MNKRGLKNFLLDLFFPKFCLSCQREGNYLCEDCSATIDILYWCFCLCEKPQRIPEAGKCRSCQKKSLNGLYFAASYKDNLVKKLIHKFKYDPYVKELALPLDSLIITHFNLIQKNFATEKTLLIPIPLSKKKLKRRGFNQSEEIAKELSKNLGIPLSSDILVKVKETLSQMELSKEEREQNIKGVFEIKNAEKIKGKEIMLVDDVYTTGSTMEEAARVLKQAGAREVWGITVAREE
jgi:competence protein ComFC